MTTFLPISSSPPSPRAVIAWWITTANLTLSSMSTSSRSRRLGLRHQLVAAGESPPAIRLLKLAWPGGEHRERQLAHPSPPKG